MSDALPPAASAWEAANTAFLSKALSWLRKALEPASGAAPEPDWTTEAASLPALLMLRARCGLSAFETKILLLCVAVELDPAIAAFCARENGPSFALCLRLFADPDWDALSPHQPLRAWRLIECVGSQATLVSATLRTDERIVHFLKGLNEIDERVGACLLPPPPGQDLPLVPSQLGVVEEVIAGWQAAERPLVVLAGDDIASKLLVASAAADASGCMLCRTTLDLLPQGAELELFERLWRREQMLLPLVLVIEIDDGDGLEPSAEIALRRLLTRLDSRLTLLAREAPKLARPVWRIEVAKPLRPEQEALWRAALGPDSTELAAGLAAQFALSAPAIETLAARPSPELWDACRRSLRPRLDRLALRIVPRASWNDLVLPPDRAELLHQLASQVRHRRRIHEEWGFAARSSRGLGISALFVGESGTGKTLAAEVLAASLSLDLYRIDLSGVVSKYIGETEKNLRRLFDAAEESGAILLFDEADALFGKRSEVRDSHDRYANIEVNYLLQRIEAYRGLAILATNLRSALDPAFLRRLRFVINFPYPGMAERQTIWERAFPPAAPVGKLDYAQLARLNLTGGNIATVALNAAFIASAEDSNVQMRHVLAAARAEYIKLDRPFRESDFPGLTEIGAAQISGEQAA